MNRVPAYIGIFLLMSLFAINPAKAQVSLALRPEFGSEIWHPDSTYTNAAGESVQINKCLFYTNAWKALVTKKGNKKQIDTVLLSNEHFLMDMNDTNSLKLPFNIPAHSIAILFTLGVDSLKNSTGIQTGVLDPANGMFWTWRSGYIMARMQGISPAANTAGKRFSYDVGGFESPYNASRTISLPLTQTIPLNANTTSSILIRVDLAKWFNGKYVIRIAQNPNCHNAGKLAMQLADNYQQMFEIISHQSK